MRPRARRGYNKRAERARRLTDPHRENDNKTIALVQHDQAHLKLDHGRLQPAGGELFMQVHTHTLLTGGSI